MNRNLQKNNMIKRVTISLLVFIVLFFGTRLYFLTENQKNTFVAPGDTMPLLLHVKDTVVDLDTSVIISVVDTNTESIVTDTVPLTDTLQSYNLRIPEGAATGIYTIEAVTENNIPISINTFQFKVAHTIFGLFMHELLFYIFVLWLLYITLRYYIDSRRDKKAASESMVQ